jgi:hypothetical protein
MSNARYATYAKRIKDIFDGLSKEDLCDVMNTAELLDIEPLTDVMAYILFEIMKKPNGEIVKLLSE